jgi:uncharacterized membrane protein YbaN (DUF454 family)
LSATEGQPYATYARSPFARRIYIALGFFFVGLGTAGIFLPLLPATPFLLLAAACFIRGSRRFYDWLLGHRLFGRYIKNYIEGRGLTPFAKISAIVLLWLTIGISALFFTNLLPLRIVLAAIAIGVTIHLLTRKTYRKEDGD